MRPQRPNPRLTALYERVLAETERAAVAHARAAAGLADEIALLRARLEQLLDNGGLAALDLDLVYAIAKLVQTQHRVSGKDADALMDAIAGILETFAPEEYDRRG